MCVNIALRGFPQNHGNKEARSRDYALLWANLLFIYYFFIETYLYRVDIISSQAIFLLQGIFIVHSLISSFTLQAFEQRGVLYAPPRWQISEPVGIRTQYLRVSSHNRTEWAIGTGDHAGRLCIFRNPPPPKE